MMANAIAKAGLILLSLGGCSGILLYLAATRPSGWAAIKNIHRVRQGHIDALVIGAVFLSVSTTGLVDGPTAAVLVATGFYTALSTAALGWWPDFPERNRIVNVFDFLALAGFALAWVWITVKAFALF
jgi:hypothetical protein